MNHFEILNLRVRKHYEYDHYGNLREEGLEYSIEIELLGMNQYKSKVIAQLSRRDLIKPVKTIRLMDNLEHKEFTGKIQCGKTNIVLFVYTDVFNLEVLNTLYLQALDRIDEEYEKMIELEKRQEALTDSKK